MQLISVRKIVQVISVVTAALGISQCSYLWPTYVKPDVNAPKHWRVKDPKTRITELKVVEIAWWKHFNDPALNRLIKEALHQNNDLRIATGNILLAKASLQQAKFQWLPSLGLGGGGYTGRLNNLQFNDRTGYSLFNQFGQKDWIYDGYTAGFVPVYTLNILSQIKQLEISKLDVESRIESAHAIRLAVIGQMSASYFTLLGLKKQLLIQNKLLNDLQAMRRYTLIQYQRGAVSDMNIVSMDQDIALIKKQIPMIKHSISSAENTIHTLLNQNPGPIKVDRSFDDIHTDAVIPVNVPGDVLKTRPDIAVAENQLKMANATIAQATSQFFPTMNISGYLGPMELTVYDGLRFFTNFLQGQIALAQPVIALTIYSDIKKAHIIKYGAYYNYLNTVRHAFQQVDDRISQHYRVNQSYHQQDIAYQKAGEQYRLAKLNYKEGAFSYADTLNFKFDMDYTEAMLNQSKQEQLLSIVFLYLSLGGGAKADEATHHLKSSQNAQKKGFKWLLTHPLWS